MEQHFLQNRDAVSKLQDLAIEINICLFCNGSGMEDEPSCRPMTTKGVDEEGAIWFFSERNSEKNRELALNPRVRLFYAHPGKSSFLIVTGNAEIIYDDRQRIDEFWSSLDKTWFEGPGDPNISLLKVKPVSAHYWDVKGNQMVNFVKMVASAATGKTLVQGEEGTLSMK